MTAVLARTFRAEALKLRRTRALWLALGAPGAVVGLYTLVILAGANSPADLGWERTAQTMLIMWGVLMLPLYVALLAALVNAVDHRARGWKHLLAQPVPRWAIHAAKLGATFALALLSSLVLAAGIVAMIAALKAAGYGAPGDPLPYRLIAESVASIYGGALFVISFHHAFSQRVRGFEWPLGLGIAATVFANVIIQSPTYWPYCPWAYPATAAMANDPSATPMAIGLSAGGAVLVALLAAWDLEHRDVTA